MWKVTRTPNGEYECHDGTRLRAIIQRDSARVWRVSRINSMGASTGADTFHTFGEAKSFVTERPGIWGV